MIVEVGGDLLSHGEAAVPSALRGLTTGFEMGTRCVSLAKATNTNEERKGK